MDRKKFIKSTSYTLGGSLIFDPIRIKKDLGNKNNKVSSIDVVVPSVIGINEMFDVGIRILTEPYYTHLNAGWNRPNPAVNGPFNLSPRGTHYMDNVLPKWEGVVNITSSDDYKGPSTFSFATGKGPYEQDMRPIRRLKGLQFTKPGIKYIRVIDSDGGIEGVSNPIHVKREPEERLFWGDLHMHSLYTDAIRVPGEIYSFARDEAFLDICAMSDHSEALSDVEWNYFSETTNEFNEPGSFVTLIGGEWTSMKYGHHNYYYRGAKGPIIRSDDPNSKDLDQLYALARSREALIIPHHTASNAMGNDWSKHDSEVERLVEIHSIWGNSERPGEQGNPLPIQFAGGEKKGQHVLDALERGFHLGFIGGGDIHDGRPGDSLAHHQDKPKEYYLTRRQGLMAVWAKNLTREAIFEALWNRRVYATTNHRTWLKFSINGYPMGSEIKVNNEMLLEVEAASNRPISHIDLVHEGRDVLKLEPSSDEELKVSWQQREPSPSGRTWYYIRLRLQDSNDMAWSSPIWITDT